ncbi:hypothetical protein GCM10018987_16000 [Streptomyces cremeus]
MTGRDVRALFGSNDRNATAGAPTNRQDHAMEDLRAKDMTRSAKGTVEASGRNVQATSGLNRPVLDIGAAVDIKHRSSAPRVAATRRSSRWRSGPPRAGEEHGVAAGAVTTARACRTRPRDRPRFQVPGGWCRRLPGTAMRRDTGPGVAAWGRAAHAETGSVPELPQGRVDESGLLGVRVVPGDPQEPAVE